MRRVLAVILLSGLVLLLTSCGGQAERNELRDDLRRFREARAVEYEQIKRDLARYAIDQKLRAVEAPVDVAKFLEWRRREWWNLTDEMAALVAYEWDNIARLSADAARFYGYEVRNFPLATDDVARFFAYADDEWNGLVRDVCIFVEWRDRELLPLRRDLRMAYERLDWEAASLQVDLASFLVWRSREWRRMVEATDDFIAWERSQGQRLRADLRRFRAARAIEARYLVADFKAWWGFETSAMPVRLVADVYRWAALTPYELARLRDDIARFGEGIGEDAVKLIDDLDRYMSAQVDLVPQLAADVERFFDVYAREYGPLEDDVRRWWRSNVALGIVMRDDMRLFFLEHGQTEASELQASLRRFFSYSGKEWKDFRNSLARFLYDDSGRAFGDRGTPARMDIRPVFDDPRSTPARGYDAGDE
ncbi:MAG: hypothetical protein J0M02_10430 [Planctomycetes bacterium]|nr:hypothetical protein [Planctomycetota bacterium]